MRSCKKSGVLVLIVLMLLVPGRFLLLAAESRPSTKPRLYDNAADGNQQIADALKTAKAENKRLLLKFGANW